MKYDLKKRIFMVREYHKFNSLVKVQRAWRTKFKNLPAPDYKTIKYNVDKLEKHGTVGLAPRVVIRQNENREKVKNTIKKLIFADPSLSIRKLASAAKVSFRTAWTIVRFDLKLKPYKIGLCQELLESDFSKRVDFANWFLGLPQYALSHIVFSDESYFYLKQPINKQNNRLWLAEAPDYIEERPLHDQHILVWCGISANCIFGPYYFVGPVNQHNYLDMLKSFFWPKMLRTENYQKYWFQQDGARPHTAKAVQTWLGEKFGKKFIKKDMWPPRSPDLNPCDFFLWGYLKARVYNPLPKTIDDLKINLEREIKSINKDILKSTFLNFKKRCDFLILKNGIHFEKNFK